MATVPLSGTNITFYSGIPFNSDYKHTRWFDNLSDQTNWFASREIVTNIHQANFQRIEGKPFVAVNMSIDSLWNVNYLSFENADYNKRFYAFITKLEYVQKNTTYVHFEIDVLQTWMFTVIFRDSFVAREHCQLSNADGTPIINTQDEGLHYGTEYDVMSATHFNPYNDLAFLVTISKNPMHTTAKYYSVWNGVPTSLCTYIHPFRLTTGTVPNANFVLDSSIGNVMNNMYSSPDAVNNVISMYITNVLPDFPNYDGNTITFDPSTYSNATIGSSTTLFVEGINYGSKDFNFLNKYNDYTPQVESKLLMYPYTVLELTDFRGNHATIKNEYINNKELVLTVRGSLGTSNKVAYTFKDYNTTGLGNTDDMVYVSQEQGIIDNNPNDLPVLADMLAAFIQGNRNQLQNQKESIVSNGMFSMLQGGLNAGNAIYHGNVMGGISQGVETARSGVNMQLQLQGLAAKQQDINNTPAELVKMGGNVNFDYGNGYTGLWIIKKQIKPEYQKKLTDYFNMFGYKRNEVKIPNFHTRQSWNYIQTVGCEITAPINNEDLEEMKNIFDSGITLWHVDDIGNYTLTNWVIQND